MHRLIEADDASASPSWERLDGIAETLTADEDQERRGEFCFLAKEQFWRTAWRARSLLSWTTTSSRDAGTGAITTRDCASWRGIARATACASKRQRRLCSDSARRPAAERHPDLPFVPEWIPDSAEAPAMFICHRCELECPRGHGLCHSGVRVVNDEQCPTRRAADRARAEPLHR